MHRIEGSELVSKRDIKSRLRRSIIDEWDARCAYCDCRPDKITLDHVLPKARGGTTERCNLVPACAPCNVSKGHCDVWEWYRSQGFFDAGREAKVRSWVDTKKPPPESEGFACDG